MYYVIYVDFSVDVYSFLATSNSSAITSETVAELISESKADSTSHGILSQDYAARVICVLSQAVDRSLFFAAFNLLCHLHSIDKVK